MAYNLIVTDEMDKIYDEIEDNPGIYPVSDDPFLAALTYHEAVLHGMNYKIIYKYDDETVYILGIGICTFLIKSYSKLRLNKYLFSILPSITISSQLT